MGAAETLMGAVGRLIFRASTITDVVDVAPRFRRIHLEGADLVGARFESGDKIQMFLPGSGMRTYTPIHWDAVRGSTTLLGFVHGESPGSRWVQRASVGEVVRFFGPRRSVPLASLGAPLVLFGDETSFAVARAARLELGDRVVPVFEVGEREVAAALLADLGLPGATLVERRADDGHLDELASALRGALAERPEAALVMTGRARAIQEMRARLGRVAKSRPGKNKAYWSLGRAGLD
jgi:NADPH-dependent ferric siderophore reductase